jgi:hypothetical protein
MKRRIKLGDEEQAAVCLMALSRCFVSPEKITIFNIQQIFQSYDHHSILKGKLTSNPQYMHFAGKETS